MEKAFVQKPPLSGVTKALDAVGRFLAVSATAIAEHGPEILTGLLRCSLPMSTPAFSRRSGRAIRYLTSSSGKTLLPESSWRSRCPIPRSLAIALSLVYYVWPARHPRCP
jgi:hypothetical protein